MNKITDEQAELIFQYVGNPRGVVLEAGIFERAYNCRECWKKVRSHVKGPISILFSIMKGLIQLPEKFR